GRLRPEGTGRDVVGQLVEGTQHRVELVVGEQTGLVQHPGVGAGPGDVVRRQPPVEVGRCAQRGHGFGRPAGEPATPQRRRALVLLVVGHQSVPYSIAASSSVLPSSPDTAGFAVIRSAPPAGSSPNRVDRKSTRLNSSHVKISY